MTTTPLSLRHGVHLARRACWHALGRAGEPPARGARADVRWCMSVMLVGFLVHGCLAGPAFSAETPLGLALDRGSASTVTSDSRTTIGITSSSSQPSTNPADTTPTPGGAAEGAGGHQHHVKRYEVAKVEFTRVETPFLIGIWILFASLAKIGFHMAPKLNKIFPESCLLIAVGVVIGFLLYNIRSVHVSPLTPDTFFLYMLPPIILDAGYFMPNRLFFDHLGTILLFAVVGTIFNTLTIGGSLWACAQAGIFGPPEEMPILDMFLFAALISAVDPVAVLAVFEEIHVNEILYIVVFGESLLNDAVTVVLYHMFEAYSEMGPANIIYTDLLAGLASFFVVAVGGTVIGVLWGFATGLVTRFTNQVRVIEPIFIFVMAYLAYLNAEIFHMSGILAITFCGITMKNYVEANISHKSHTTVKYAMKMLSSSSETIIFMFLGVATVQNDHVWNTWFVVLTILFCSVYRICGVIILTALANKFRLHKLNKVEKFVMSYGGLRGAVAFALVLLIDRKVVPSQPMFITTTIAVIYFTVFIQGITIKPLVKILNVKRAEKRKPTMNERIHERFMDHMMAGIEDIIGKHGNYHIRDKFKRFDNKFIRPFLLRNYQGAEPKILETYSKLAMRDAIEYMQRNASTIGNISGTESMSAIFRNYTNNFNGSPSFSQLDTSTWNIDMQELEYNPSKKDMTDARIHHLLAEELCKPYRRHRRLSYSRHAVNDRDLTTQVNYRTHMNIRRVVGDRKHHHKRSKRLNKDGKQNHVSFPEFQQNGSAKQFTHDYPDAINEIGIEDPAQRPAGRSDDDGGIMFTAKTALPEDDIIEEDEARLSKSSDDHMYMTGEHARVSTPTATETMLPWKRGDEGAGALKQSEFPSWASNKEYLAYNSPSNTFLGGIAKPKQAKSIIGLFRRESSSSAGGPPGATAGPSGSEGSLGEPPPPGQGPGRPQLTGRSYSIGGPSSVLLMEEVGHADPLGVASRPASIMQGPNRGQTRRGSMLELTGGLSRDAIMEEKFSKSLPESEKMSARRTPVSKGTPRGQVKRQQTVGTSLLSSSSSSVDGEP